MRDDTFGGFAPVGFACHTPQAEAALRRMPPEAAERLRAVLASGRPLAHSRVLAESRERAAAELAKVEAAAAECRRLVAEDRPRREARRRRERVLDLELRTIVAKANGILRDLKRRP